jgi:hypothetical protein
MIEARRRLLHVLGAESSDAEQPCGKPFLEAISLHAIPTLLQGVLDGIRDALAGLVGELAGKTIGFRVFDAERHEAPFYLSIIDFYTTRPQLTSVVLTSCSRDADEKFGTRSVSE